MLTEEYCRLCERSSNGFKRFRGGSEQTTICQASKLLEWNNTHRFNRMIATIFSEVAGDSAVCDLEPTFSYSDRFLEFGLLARVKKVLATAGSDYDFSCHLHDLILKRSFHSSNGRSARAVVDGKQGSREQLLLNLISRPDFEWPDAGEVEYVLGNG